MIIYHNYLKNRNNENKMKMTRHKNKLTDLLCVAEKNISYKCSITFKGDIRKHGTKSIIYSGKET